MLSSRRNLQVSIESDAGHLAGDTVKLKMVTLSPSLQKAGDIVTVLGVDNKEQRAEAMSRHPSAKSRFKVVA